MKKLCPNLDREDGLDTVLEVPVPDEASTFASHSKSAENSPGLSWGNVMKGWMRPHRHRSTAPSSVLGRAAELHLMLGVVGAAPLVSVPVEDRESVPMITRSIKQDPIEVLRAKYIVKQYAAAVGGEKAMGGVSSMYAVGKVQLMMMSATKSASGRRRAHQVGGFVVWQRSPEVWCLELVVAGCKLAAGCDGRVAWRQGPWQYPCASRGPPRPLRRSLQGLDPWSTASLFSNAVWTGEKTTNGEACFVLRLDADGATRRALSSANAEVVRHTLWGHFSQRTGLLVQLEDAHLLRVIDPVDGRAVYWETNTESTIGDYRPVDGVHVAHAGRTAASLVRSRAGRGGHVRRARSHVEEAWTIEEVGFDVHGLSMDCFLPPSDLREERKAPGDVADKHGRTRGGDRAVSAVRFGPSQVAAVDSDDSDLTADEDERL